MKSLSNLTAGNVKSTMKALGAGSSDLWNVPVEQVKVLTGFNVRTENAAYALHIAEIGESILANGYYKDRPLSGYVAKDGDDSIVYVTDGHTRLAAIAYANERGAQITTVPVVTKPAGTSLEDLTVGLVTSNSGKPLTPIEKGAVIKRLTGYGMEETVIASRIGVTLGYVRDLLLLMGAAKSIRKAVEDGQISAANAVAMMKKHGSEAAEAISGAVEAAEEAGEAKVSKKTLRAPKRDLVAEGVEWIANRTERNVRPFVEMLSMLTGASVEDINAKLAGDDEEGEEVES